MTEQVTIEIVSTQNISQTTINQVANVIEVQTIGLKGDIGPIGLQGEGLTVIYPAGDVLGIGGHRAVYIDSNNQVQYSSNLDVNKANKLIGISLNAGVYLSNINVRTKGLITDPSFSFEIDKAIYLLDNGLIGQTYPSEATVCKVLGYATSTNTFLIDIKQTITIGN